ncbi:c-type cytochrome [Desulfofustis limnaeus]|jgi:mono/diheme cytochrome c family protein|uniref:c-type cytochrome n=1 Tax=Desulfofustis limnaeus TaxID=2740163 RepID=UPI0024E02639|nr:c-type cytochrome [Desulfofustis limnaeus]MDX9894623.1 c-type cytochrome [Desulfofustis sp.]
MILKACCAACASWLVPVLGWSVLAPAVADVYAAEEAAVEAVAGQAVYIAHCAPCHGDNGEGFRRVYPPLADSRFFTTDLNRLPCVIRYGLRGEIEVGGVVFDQQMPGNSRLTNEDMLVLIGYLQQRWGEVEQLVDVEEWLRTCR